MNREDFHGTADERRNARRAESVLASMDAFEEVAVASVESPIAVFRRAHAEAYERRVGVPPAQRAALRPRLEEIAMSGWQSVDEAIAAVRRQVHANGSDSPGG